ncbi:L-aminopeptidase/D-esterase-like protein [Microvirga flocculans]|uniref:L-aminopeptidase/D-esterase-like protein n=1 Tax=Microvirga flocculans TaxID=217168 RepID=A0A7W6IEQ4_9HYPH|nr:P1 family peptidase [Microvirga flocculans]MBB4039791.1 L-aminopeptidase/D-esterase-like protein [Microvirga flocculans]
MTHPRNLITDVAGLRIGNAHDARLGSGVTVALFDEPAVVSCEVMGGAPGTRETDILQPDKMVPSIHGVVLSGGSAFGLDAASGVQAYLRRQGIGFQVGNARVPLVSQAVIFDLMNGGDKEWGLYPPYRELGFQAAEKAGLDFDLGTAGGGYGATTANLKGGLGSASVKTSSGHTVGALVIVNAIASAVIGSGPHFWAGGLEEGDEFGGLGLPARVDSDMRRLFWKGGPQPATTIALIATDAVLTKAQAKRLAVASHAGLARGLRFSHALFDGDTIFAASTGRRPLGDAAAEFTELTALAADCLTRAIARGVYEATALPYPGAQPAWRDRFGTGRGS